MLSHADVLLLNRSNLPSRPIYPYAFVQLKALARRYRLKVASFDLMGVPTTREQEWLSRLLVRTEPRLVGLHLRQADTLVFQDYGGRRPLEYHPVEDTADTIVRLREMTDVPIAVGGFGFTTHSERLVRRLRPDFGVAGDAEPLFERFDEVLRGTRESIDNLVYADGGAVRSAARRFGAPLDDREYDDDVIDDLERFYGTSVLYGPDAPTVPVELARGCPYRCYFCTEPAVKGRRPQVRDLDAVMADVELLASRGIHKIWIVCSELNIGGPDLALRVAERFIQINEASDRPVTWRAYRLPRWLSRGDLDVMRRSGFTGGWNDFPALDDDGLRKTRVPYRVRDAIASITDELDASIGERGDYVADFSMFLGHAFATPQSIASSLAEYHAAGFHERFTAAQVAPATRVFESSGRDIPGIDAAQSFGRGGPNDEVDLSLPTFAFAPALLDAAGTQSKVLEVLEYVRTTILSTSYRQDLDWRLFLTSTTTPDWVARQLDAQGARMPRLKAAADGVAADVHARLTRIRSAAVVWSDVLGDANVDIGQDVARVVITLLARIAAPSYAETLAFLGLPQSADRDTPYSLLVALLPRFESHAELFAVLERELGIGTHSLAAWRMRKLLFDKNLALDPVLRQFVVPATVKPHEGAHPGSRASATTIGA